MSDTTANANLTSPIIPQPDAPGQIVGMVLQNTGTAATAANTEVTFGQAFLPGAVQPGQQLYATINGTEIPVQMDTKTFNADGSVNDAVLTFAAPSIAANSSANIMLSVGPALAAQPAAIDLAAALKNYSLTVDLAIQTGTTSAPATTNYHIDAVAAMEAALANGTASYWQQGPNATQARVTVPVTKAMQMVFDITANANGTFTTDVQFLNDEGYVQNAWGQPLNRNGQVVASDPSGGVETYSETITQNGQIVSNNSNIQQGMYQNWHTVVTTQPSASQINVQ
ncbi:MAG TPA: hypothetical protein VFN77_00990, partial [Acetobacteraceae bacterium]|nr:hypothetical protein [Acetobacteraceae bacterium]